MRLVVLASDMKWIIGESANRFHLKQKLVSPLSIEDEKLRRSLEINYALFSDNYG